ncbi:flagellar hook-basal body complex protein FliE [Sphingomonas sp. MMS12-HWE2-04]|uniref:flagellar hook-basal body complex protein FliE n=1 Tax=Sphingomonas sp. MMS12-HWE2-04 TaxID=3234199 RepID=UPI00384F1B32
MSIGGVKDAMSIDRVMALRAQILERNTALARAGETPASAAPTGAGAAKGGDFTSAFKDAFAQVNDAQNQAGALAESYERGETVDIAKVMLARQQASVGFEATLQVRNKLLSAYKDIMSMPV